MIETILFFIVIGTILFWLMPFIIPIAIAVGIISFIMVISESKMSNNKLKRSTDFSSELGKTMREKDMIDSMFGNKELDSIQETLITKNVLDNTKK